MWGWLEGSQPGEVEMRLTWEAGQGGCEPPFAIKSLIKSGFDVESQGTALHTHSCSQLTLLIC